MRKKLVAGNWKMHGSRDSVAALMQGLLASGPLPCDTLVCPSFVFLEQVRHCLSDQTEGRPMVMGGQNVDWHEQGAFTGEVSATMLKEAGCTHVLTGHSERRQLFGETDEQVALKVEACMANGLVPVICVGESLAERQANETLTVVRRQLTAAVRQVGIGALANSVIAYEPVWAIGTGESATPEQAEFVHVQIREMLADQDLNIADNIQILYGGSVNAANAGALFAQSNIDGALVGGASLKATDFLAICRAAAATEQN